MLMPGMLTDEEMAALDRARGPEFDRLFLNGMIKHHQGAIDMVDVLFKSYGAAQDETVFKFASDVYADQSTEIDRMNEMLEEQRPNMTARCDSHADPNRSGRSRRPLAIDRRRWSAVPRVRAFVGTRGERGAGMRRRLPATPRCASRQRAAGAAARRAAACRGCAAGGSGAAAAPAPRRPRASAGGGRPRQRGGRGTPPPPPPPARRP